MKFWTIIGNPGPKKWLGKRWYATTEYHRYVTSAYNLYWMAQWEAEWWKQRGAAEPKYSDVLLVAAR